MRLCATIRVRRSLLKPWQSHLSIYATCARLAFDAFHPTRGARHQFAVRAPLPRRRQSPAFSARRHRQASAVRVTLRALPTNNVRTPSRQLRVRDGVTAHLTKAAYE